MSRKKVKTICDGAILLFASFLAVSAWRQGKEAEPFQDLVIAAAICAGIAAIDLIHQSKGKSPEEPVGTKKPSDWHAIQELVLLDEQNKPVKSWVMAGRTSLVIGRKHDDEEVEVDLEGCEFSTFVDFQHAALNYCLDQWYLEDLGSSNGTRVQKSEDGICYKATNRPCRVMAGDIIYIANTRLLLT